MRPTLRNRKLPPPRQVGSRRFKGAGWHNAVHYGLGYMRAFALDRAGWETADHADYDVTDLDIRFLLALDVWPPAAASAAGGKDSSSPGQRSWRLRLDTDGKMTLLWSVDGSGYIQKVSTAAYSFINGTPHWIRVTLDVDNGATQNEVKFYTSDDPPETDPDDVVWTQLGATVTTAGVTSIFPGNLVIGIGGFGGIGMLGKVYYAEIRNGIDGTVVANPDFRYRTDYVSPTSLVDQAGKTWTPVSFSGYWVLPLQGAEPVTAVHATVIAQPAIAGATAPPTQITASSLLATGPAIAGAFGPSSTVSAGATIRPNPAAAGAFSPAAVVSLSTSATVIAPPALVGAPALAALVSTGATIQPSSALGGALSPAAAFSTSTSIAVTAPPALAGALGEAARISISKAITAQPSIAGALGEPARVAISKVISVQPAIAGGAGEPARVSAGSLITPGPAVAGAFSPPHVVSTPAVGDKIITSPPATGGAYFPGAGNYSVATAIKAPPALAGAVGPGLFAVGELPGLSTEGARAGAFFPAGGTRRSVSIAVAGARAGAYFPGAGEYLDVANLATTARAHGGAFIPAPTVVTNQAPSVQKLVIAPCATAGSFFPAGGTQRSSTLMLAGSRAGAVAMRATAGQNQPPPDPPPGVEPGDWETPAISREDRDVSISVKAAGHARSRSLVGSSRSSGSSGSATSKK